MSMFPIATTGTIPVSTFGQVFFSGIPQTFTHLQLRVYGRTTSAVANSQTAGLQLSGSTSYDGHGVGGNGTAVFATRQGFFNAWFDQPYIPGASSTANVFGIQIIDILDYTNTNKNKVIRGLGGYDANGSGVVSINSGFSINTAAITTITVNVSGAFFAAGSRVDLYGISTSNTTGA